MATARSHTAAKSGKSASAGKSKGSASAKQTASAKAAQTHDETAASKKTSQSDMKTVTLTIPLDGDVLTTAAHAAMLPVLAAKDLLQRRDAGIPAYIGIAGLAAVGLVEWPVAAVTGVGFAYLRRWGPLRPESAKPPQAKATMKERVEVSGAQKKAA